MEEEYVYINSSLSSNEPHERIILIKKVSKANFTKYLKNRYALYLQHKKIEYIDLELDKTVDSFYKDKIFQLKVPLWEDGGFYVVYKTYNSVVWQHILDAELRIKRLNDDIKSNKNLIENLLTEVDKDNFLRDFDTI